MLVTLVTKRIKIPEMFVFYVLRDGGRRNFFPFVCCCEFLHMIRKSLELNKNLHHFLFEFYDLLNTLSQDPKIDLAMATIHNNCPG